MSELETRSVELEYREDSAAEEGYVEGYAVRWDEQASIDGRYVESFQRGAFDGSEDVKLYRDHRELIGHVIESENREDGFWIRARVALTALGKDTLALLRSGALNRFSVGFRPVSQEQRNGVLVRTSALLREVSVVERPAYAGAHILAVREESNEREPLTHHKEETVDDSTVSAAELTEVRGEIEELSRRFDAYTPAAPVKEKVDTRSAAAFVKALASGDAEAAEAYQRTLDHLHDEEQHRAYTGGTTADAPVKDAWVGDLTRIFDNSSGVLAQVFATGTLPATGNNIEFAELVSNTVQVTEQTAEGNDLAYGKVTLATRTAPVKTYGGYVQLSRQAIERSTLPVLNRSLEALAVAAGARKKAELRAAVASVVAARKAVASNGGVVVLGATLAAGAAGNWEDALIDAAIKYDGLDANPEALIVSASVFKKLRSLTVSGERVFTVADGNHTGSLNLPGLTGNLAGLPVYLDAGQTGDEAYFVNGRAIRQYDSSLVSLQDENIINLSKDFSVYRYGAIAAEIPQLIVPVKLAAS